MAVGRSGICSAAGYRGHAPGGGRTIAAVIALGAILQAPAPAVAAGGLPPVQVTYSGRTSAEVFPTLGKPSQTLRAISWTASSSSHGSDGSFPLEFSSVSGSSTVELTGNCDDSSATLSLAGARNPVGSGWTLSESSDYPRPGWRYVLLGVPDAVPVLENRTGRCSSVQVEELIAPNEILLKQETFSPVQLREYEAVFDPLEFTPGTPASRTRTFSFDGISHCSCLPAPTHVTESITLTVSATSPAGGNDLPGRAAPGGSSPPGSAPPRRRVSEARRRLLKEQAREDLGPALERDWAIHGLASVLGLNSGLALSTALTELGQQGLLLDGDEATTRVINDYRIIADPPDPHYNRLASPRTPAPPALRSCAGAPAAERAVCTSLREAEAAMLLDDARAGAISQAMLVTINRDSGAIRAHDYAAAQRQYVQFGRLRAELRGTSAVRGADGAKVAAILRSLGESGAVSIAQAAASIADLRTTLGRARIPAAGLGRLAGDALRARETNALTILASPAG